MFFGKKKGAGQGSQAILLFLELDFGAEVIKETLAQSFSFVEVAAFHGIQRGGFLFWQFQVQEPVDFGDGITADGVKRSQFSNPTEGVAIGGVLENGEGHFSGNGSFEEASAFVRGAVKTFQFEKLRSVGAESGFDPERRGSVFLTLHVEIDQGVGGLGGETVFLGLDPGSKKVGCRLFLPVLEPQEEMRFNSVVGVEEKQGFGLGCFGALVSLLANIADGAVNQCEPGKAVGEGVCLGDRPIAGMAVDNDNLEIAIGLAGKVGEEGRQIFFLV